MLGAQLELEGLLGVILEVLAQLKEARDADHGDAGEQREGDREADPKPVCKGRVHQRPPAHYTNGESGCRTHSPTNGDAGWPCAARSSLYCSRFPSEWSP